MPVMYKSSSQPSTTARTSRRRTKSMEGRQPLHTLMGDDYIRAFLHILTGTHTPFLPPHLRAI